MKSGYLVCVIVAAGCGTESPETPAGPVPGMGIDQSYRGINERGAPQPCGYDVSEDSGSPDGSSPSRHYDSTTRYTYDSAGNLLTEDTPASGDTPAIINHIEYDAMGHVVKQTLGFTDQPFSVYVIAYDAFGRKIRVSTDQDSDGAEDVVTTYVYPDGANEPTTRSTRYLTTKINGTSYDRTYHWDTLGRMTGFDQDNGPDGTVDVKDDIAYDDAAGTRTQTDRDAAGTVQVTIADQFNHANQLAHELETEFNVEGGPWYTDSVWDYDGERLLTSTEHERVKSASAAPFFTMVTTYRYSGCK